MMENKTHTIEWEEIRYGQPRPYADTINEFLISSGESERMVKTFCTKFLDPSKNEEPNALHNGLCNFPHGLESFFTFTRTVEGKYLYIVTHPFTG
jgi:hypothetical protein